MASSAIILRPDGVVIDGRLEHGLEVRVENGQIVDISRHRGATEPYVLSVAFVNAHSHLEYRGFQDALTSAEYFDWIYELTQKKLDQTPEQVKGHCQRAAQENRATGVSLILEHSDRPGAAMALKDNGLRGYIFHEVITMFEVERRQEIFDRATAKASHDFLQAGIMGNPSPHAPHTVDQETLANLSAEHTTLSIHVAESKHEREYWENNAGRIGDRRREQGIGHPAPGSSLVDYLAAQGFVREGVQWVHCCDLTVLELRRLAEAGVSVAHCPRSNVRLQCPAAPVREMLDLGIVVGLGLDSPASSGPIDMFDEMRAAHRVSVERRRPVTAEEVWRMATSMGARSLGAGDWDVKVGSTAPLIKIHGGGRETTEDVVFSSAPQDVSWVSEA